MSPSRITVTFSQTLGSHTSSYACCRIYELPVTCVQMCILTSSLPGLFVQSSTRGIRRMMVSAKESGPQLKTVGANGADRWNSYRLSVHIAVRTEKTLLRPSESHLRTSL